MMILQIEWPYLDLGAYAAELIDPCVPMDESETPDENVQSLR